LHTVAKKESRTNDLKAIAAFFVIGIAGGGTLALAGPAILTVLASKPVAIGTTFLAYEGIVNAPESPGSKTYKSRTPVDDIKTTAVIAVIAFVLGTLISWLKTPTLKLPEAGARSTSSGSFEYTPRPQPQIPNEPTVVVAEPVF
jgi:hypothetical protein